MLAITLRTVETHEVITLLKSQISQGEAILFTGAGFSAGASDRAGNPLPIGRVLSRELWGIAFPSESFDEGTRLPDAYRAAVMRDRRATKELLQSRLSVRADDLPDFYQAWFNIPWERVYTLNLDDLEVSVASRFDFQRSISSISATSGTRQGGQPPGALEVVHLNGAVWDELENMTFSDVDYGLRAGVPDEWYSKAANDVIGRTVVYVGTALHEPPLWQYVELRKTRGSGKGTRELRPRSYLVIPELNAARRLVLRDLNVEWIPMDADQFAREVLGELGQAIEEGHQVVRQKYDADARRQVPGRVSQLVGSATETPTEYLLGQEPTWTDIKYGRSIERAVDEDVYAFARATLSGEVALPLVLSGTAGSGKSTSLMRLGARLAGEGVAVHWIDSTFNVDLQSVRSLAHDGDEPVAILIDDADTFGRTLTGWVRELPSARPGVFVGVALRTTRIDGVVDRDTLGFGPHEISMPPLDDSEIESLIQLLDKHNRLGILKGKEHDERVYAFRQQAGRQLLVAMIQATSGKDFKQKVVEEFLELSEIQRFLYSAICLVHSRRHEIDRSELLRARGGGDNEALNELEALVRRHLVTRDTVHTRYKARHRVIADEVVDAMQQRKMTGAVLEGLCFSFAQDVNAGTPFTSRKRKRMIRFINHEFLLQMAPDLDTSRQIYSVIEPLLNWDYHYWLHRGAIEVEVGDLALANHFLDQSRSLMPDDPFVQAEYGYLLMKQAVSAPDSGSASDLYARGFATLKDLIDYDPGRNAHAFHIIGSQGLAWSRRSGMTREQRREVLRELSSIMDDAQKHHPKRHEITILAKDVRQELLMTAVTKKA